jgi:hypothetical protein
MDRRPLVVGGVAGVSLGFVFLAVGSYVRNGLTALVAVQLAVGLGVALLLADVRYSRDRFGVAGSVEGGNRPLVVALVGGLTLVVGLAVLVASLAVAG